jgi:MFS family permease
MTATMSSAPASRSFFQGMWRRQIDHYPNTGPRMVYLAIVVLATIVLYYQFYVPGAVSPSIIAHFGMTFPYYVYIIVVGNAIGAFGSLAAGLADRWGRANLVAYGLVIVGLLVTFALPNAGSKLTYGIWFSLVAVVEGVILVATPALVRDFSPQLGRASAMGFWTLGPVIGSLVLAEVSSHTLTHLTAWQDQFVIAGIAGLVVGVIAVVGLRELSPALRDQLMVSMRDRALIEARAKGIDVEESLRHPWRQMLHWDIVGSAFAISVFLIIYYTAVGFFTVYFTSLFGFSLAQANGIGNWFWAFDAGDVRVRAGHAQGDQPADAGGADREPGERRRRGRGGRRDREGGGREPGSRDRDAGRARDRAESGPRVPERARNAGRHRRGGRARAVEELVVGVRRRPSGLHPAHLPDGRPVGPAPGAQGRRGARAQRAAGAGNPVRMIARAACAAMPPAR